MQTEVAVNGSKVVGEYMIYSLMATYIDAKQQYSSAKHRLNRYCKRMDTSYSQLRALTRKPEVWLSMQAKSRHFENVKRTFLSRFAKRDKPSSPETGLVTQPRVKAETKREASLVEPKPASALAYNDDAGPEYMDCYSRRVIIGLENRVSKLDNQATMLQGLLDGTRAYHKTESDKLKQNILFISNAFLNLFRLHEGLRDASKKYLKAGSYQHEEYLRLAAVSRGAANYLQDTKGIQYLDSLLNRELQAYGEARFKNFPPLVERPDFGQIKSDEKANRSVAAVLLQVADPPPGLALPGTLVESLEAKLKDSSRKGSSSSASSVPPTKKSAPGAKTRRK